MVWRGKDLSTFDVETLRGWIADLEGERLVIRAEIDRRTVEVVDPPTEGLTEKEKERMWEIDPLNPRSTDRGAPPRRRDEGG